MRRFSASEVGLIVLLLVTSFYLYRNDWNQLFDITTDFSITHNAELGWGLGAFAVFLLCGFASVSIKWFVVDPWWERREERRIWNAHVEAVIENLLKSRELIWKIEDSMELFWLMVSHEEYLLRERA